MLQVRTILASLNNKIKLYCMIYRIQPIYREKRGTKTIEEHWALNYLSSSLPSASSSVIVSSAGELEVLRQEMKSGGATSIQELKSLIFFSIAEDKSFLQIFPCCKLMAICKLSIVALARRVARDWGNWFEIWVGLAMEELPLYISISDGTKRVRSPVKGDHS